MAAGTSSMTGGVLKAAAAATTPEVQLPAWGKTPYLNRQDI